MIIGRKRINKKEQLENAKEPEKMSLYLLMDAPKIGIVQYMRDNGIELKGIFYDIIDANYGIMQEDEPTRIAIIETGVGIFSKINNRDEIISLIGMCQTDDKKATVFYTDSAFKSTIYKAMPSTDIVKYISTLGVVEQLETYNEEYKYGGAEDAVASSLLQYRGNEYDYEIIEHKQSNLNIPDNIVGDKEDTVRTFDIRY